MIRISPALSVSRIDDELVLLDQNSGRYFGLNPIGSRIFELLKESGDSARVLQVLLAEYEVAEDRLRTDIDAFVEQLKVRGLLTVEAS